MRQLVVSFSKRFWKADRLIRELRAARINTRIVGHQVRVFIPWDNNPEMSTLIPPVLSDVRLTKQIEWVERATDAGVLLVRRPDGTRFKRVHKKGPAGFHTYLVGDDHPVVTVELNQQNKAVICRHTPTSHDGEVWVNTRLITGNELCRFEPAIRDAAELLRKMKPVTKVA